MSVSRSAAVFALVCCFVAAGGSGTAWAQAPGVHTPRQHAEPPLPGALPSPMPSLPPPVAMTPGEGQASPIWFGSWVIRRPGYSARVNLDGSLNFGDRLIGDGTFVDPVAGIGPHFSIDATDAIMRILGEDPYLYDKLQLLDATREQRIALRKLHDEETMERALADLPAYLQAVWAYPGWSPSTRRRVLFALWDEAAEEGNDLIVEGGERARNTIARFIAAKLPPGSPDAFTDKELVALNRARTSRTRFQPYEPAESPGEEPSEQLMAEGGLQVTRLLAAF